METKEQNKLKVKRQINFLLTDLIMLENGIDTVGTVENSNKWLSIIRRETSELQTLTNQYHETDI